LDLLYYFDILGESE